MTITNLNVRRADETNDNRCLTPKDVLESCIADIEDGEQYESIVVLKIRKDGCFDVSWAGGNIKCSEMIAAAEVFKQQQINMMGYTVAPEDLEFC